MRPFTLTALLAVALVLLIGAPVAAARSGDHAWFGSVFSTGGAGDESAVAVATDAAGRPIVVGSAITAPAGDLDMRIASWTTLGVWRWTSVENYWDNPDNPASDDRAAGVVVDDATQCAYVAGTTQGVTTGNDIVLLKVADGLGGWLPGDIVWAKTASAAVGRDDEAEAVARDKAGNVYVTGGMERADGTMDVVTVKFLPDGTVDWKLTHNNSTTRFDRGLAIAVYGSSVYVAGLSNRSGHGDDLVLLKYTTGGDRRWVRYFDDPLPSPRIRRGHRRERGRRLRLRQWQGDGDQAGRRPAGQVPERRPVRVGEVGGRQRRRERRLVGRRRGRQGKGARDRLPQADRDRIRHRDGDVCDRRHALVAGGLLDQRQDDGHRDRDRGRCGRAAPMSVDGARGRTATRTPSL